jgi:hypothetical protein
MRRKFNVPDDSANVLSGTASVIRVEQSSRFRVCIITKISQTPQGKDRTPRIIAFLSSHSSLVTGHDGSKYHYEVLFSPHEAQSTLNFYLDASTCVLPARMKGHLGITLLS